MHLSKKSSDGALTNSATSAMTFHQTREAHSYSSQNPGQSKWQQGEHKARQDHKRSTQSPLTELPNQI